MTSHSSTGGLVFVWFFFLDAPILLLFPLSSLKIFGDFAPLIQFGLFGTALWFLIPWTIDKLLSRIVPNSGRSVRMLAIFGILPFLFLGFFRLSFFSTKHLMRQERPAELKKMLNQETSGFLTEKVVFEEHAPAGISSITRMNCRAGAGDEIVLALPRGIVFLNEKGYQVQHKVDLSDRKSFSSIEPVVVDGGAPRLLAHKFQEDVYLLDLDGKERWKSSAVGSTGGIEGVASGDVDGDGNPEFAIFYRYRDGIHLVDADGRTRWKHPVYALGHLEMADVDGNGKVKILYTNSNNANRMTELTIVDAEGSVVAQRKISTASSEFAVTRWPDPGAPNIVLTEEERIRLVDLNGDTVMTLGAPGCRPFGKLKAVSVKFSSNSSPYLAVRKSLHPDLFVLYVYDTAGKLVYQKTETTEGGRIPTLASVPAAKDGTEKLLVGGTTKDFKAQVLEYSR
jgi:hypothetical protein